MDYQSELAKGVILVSTVFFGLIGLLIGLANDKTLKDSARKWLRGRVMLSFLFGICALFSALLWFLKPLPSLPGISLLLLLFQVAAFWAVIYGFWDQRQ